MADTGSRAFESVGLRPLACWDCGFESRRWHGCRSLVSVVCCSLRLADPSCRVVLPSVCVCVCVLE